MLVLLHGLMMDASLWDGVIADLSADHRCVAPTLPLGHTVGASLTFLPHGQLVEVEDSYTLIPLDQPAGLAQIIREFTRTSESVIERRQMPGPA